MAKNFVHLHVHTEYSLLDGLSKIDKLIEHVKKSGMDSVAITDHGVMYGVIEFYKAAKSEGIKPIIGMEGYTTDVKLTEKPERGKFRNYHLLLLAKDNEGYKNLIKLTSISHLEGYYYRPRVDRETLAKYSKGLICTSSCAQGEIAQSLIDGDYKRAKEVANWYLQVFDKNYFLEVQRHNYQDFVKEVDKEEIKNDLLAQADNEKTIFNGVLKLSRELGIPIVATNDAHYVKRQDAQAQDALVCIATGKNVEDTKRLRFIDAPSFYLKTKDEMYDLFSDLPEALENTVKIAKMCDVTITLGKWFFPEIILSEGRTPEKDLKIKAQKGLKKRFVKPGKDLKERLEYELEIIIKKGYAPYFLIFQDMARWANERNIPINTRGSAAGSLVSYSLGITSVDPIKYGLPFERFLNPFRPSPPDIDLDIADDKREEMISYLVDKYDKDKVAQICTFGRMLARASVRDVARVLGYPYAQGDRIAKLIPIGSQGFPMTIDRAIEESRDLKELYQTDKEAKKIIDLAKQIEGNTRHISVHAAGLVVSPRALTDFTPVQLEPSGDKVITQYEMHACEDVGLVKLDILGIRNLSILRRAVELAETTKGKGINLSGIPLDNAKTYEMLSKGETLGTFQLSGSGMTRYLVELKPERIEDIMAMIALFRPGPMANIPEYIARKKKEKEITYIHPKMKKFLEKSFGILVYQEDLLFAAMELAGYDWESVDQFRKAVGKKIPKEMKKQHEIFVEGCIKHSGVTRKKAEEIWKLFEPFQGYGFNKAHAASYGVVAYQTAYMKANYPVEFMCALLTSESNDTDKVSLAINECARMGIKILAPSINESDVDFKIVEESDSLNRLGIRFGLSAIKNVGNAAIDSILEARKDSKFNSFSDFLSKVDTRRVNKKVLESLIKVGAMGNFGKRAELLSSIDELRSSLAKIRSNSNQQGLFSQEELKKSTKVNKNGSKSELREFSSEELESLERQLLGFSLSGTPIIELIEPISSQATHKIYEIEHVAEKDLRVKIAAVISEVRVVITKRTGQEMAFVKVADDTGSIDLIVFPRVYGKIRSQLTDNRAVLISGKVESREEATSIIAESIIDKDFLQESTKRLYIRVPEGTGVTELKNLKRLLLQNPGAQKVTLVFEGHNHKRIDLELGISWSESLAHKISNTLENKHS